MDAIAGPLPVKVFMEMAGYPLEKYEEFRELVSNFFDARDPQEHQKCAGQIYMEMTKIIHEKTENPGDDMVSRLCHADFQGRKFNLEELQSITFMLFLAGLDTVTNGMTFGIRHMARNPEFQQFLREHPERTLDAVEELLRRYTFTGIPRMVREDMDFGGVRMQKGDMVFCLLPMVGLNEALNPDALTVDIDRKQGQHVAFSTGAHICLGRHLGRLELKVLYEMWLREIPQFSIDADKPTGRTRGGTVIAMPQLWLRW